MRLYKSYPPYLGAIDTYSSSKASQKKNLEPTAMLRTNLKKYISSLRSTQSVTGIIARHHP